MTDNTPDIVERALKLGLAFADEIIRLRATARPQTRDHIEVLLKRADELIAEGRAGLNHQLVLDLRNALAAAARNTVAPDKTPPQRRAAPMSEALITPGRASLIRAAAAALRDIYDEGYIDWSVEGSPNLDHLADQIDAMVTTYAGCKKDER